MHYQDNSFHAAAAHALISFDLIPHPSAAALKLSASISDSKGFKGASYANLVLVLVKFGSQWGQGAGPPLLS